MLTADEVQLRQAAVCAEFGHHLRVAEHGLLRRGGEWKVSRCPRGCGEVVAAVDSAPNFAEKLALRMAVGRVQRAPWPTEIGYRGEPIPLLVEHPGGAVTLLLEAGSAVVDENLRVTEVGVLGSRRLRVGWELVDRQRALTAPAPVPESWLTIVQWEAPAYAAAETFHGELRIAPPT